MNRAGPGCVRDSGGARDSGAAGGGQQRRACHRFLYAKHTKHLVYSLISYQHII
jgi:hypothetical protein